jgi:magnesium transporter
MQTVLVHVNGKTTQPDTIDPAWFDADAPETVWIDIEGPGESDRALLEHVLHVHELVIEDALAEIHHPKIERYDNLLYLILHGIIAETAQGKTGFATQDVDFIIGRNYLVSVHHARSRSIDAEKTVCLRHPDLFTDGPLGIAHRIIDQMVDHYRPEVDHLEERLEKLERMVFGNSRKNPIRILLGLKRDVASLRRVALPERDAVGRLARREFPEISEKMAYRFRDVYDHLVRLTDEALFLQDRVTGLIDAHLSNQSNRLNQVMKVLTVIATIFMPLTVLTSMWGMNVALPHLPGSDPAQFWWVVLMMVGLSAVMLWFFRRKHWL